MNRKKTIILSVLVFISLMMWSALKEPGINDLEVDFRELDFVRNENNTGPVIRRYLVTVSDTIWADLEHYGDLMPYNKLGTTEVFFFLEDSTLPQQLKLTGAPFDTTFGTFLMGHYSKNNMGQVVFKK